MLGRFSIETDPNTLSPDVTKFPRKFTEHAMQFVKFGAGDIENVFARLSEDELNRISFGVIQVDAQGTILMFNVAEAEMTGVERKAAVGKNFFTEVAVCTSETGFRGRFDAGVKAGNLNVVFEWRLGGADMSRVQVHIKKADRGERYWICTKRL